MTTVVPDTGVIEGIDEQSVPGCEMYEGCEAPAAFRLVLACGHGYLSCSDCECRFTDAIAYGLDLCTRGRWIECAFCGWRWRKRRGLRRTRVSDVIVAVIPL